MNDVSPSPIGARSPAPHGGAWPDDAKLDAARTGILELALEAIPLTAALEGLVRIVEAHSTSGVLGSVLLLDDDGDHLRLGAGPSLPPAYNAAIDGIAIGPRVGSCGTAVHRREPVVVADVATDPLWTDFRELALSHDLAACWSWPIMSGAGAVVGTFAMYHREPREPAPADIELVASMLRSAALLIERKTTEERARRSEERLRFVLAAGRLGAWELDLASGTLTTSSTCRRNFGRDPDAEFSYDELRDAVHPDDQRRMRAGVERSLASGEDYDIEYRILTPAGDARWVAIRAQPSYAADGSPLRMTGVSIDVTDRRAAEASLRDSEERLRLAVDNAEVGFWDVDVAHDELIWPARTKAMFGISADVPVGMDDFYRGLHPDDAAATGDAYAAAADPARRAFYDVEYRTVGKEDGIVRWIAAKGRGVFDGPGPGARCLRVIGTVIDVSRRKATEAALLDLNETLERRVETAVAERERAWNNARDLLVVVGADGIFRAVNPAWTATLGWRADELVGRSYADFVHPDDLPSSRAALAIAVNEALAARENRYRHQDGSWRWFSWVASPEGDLVYASGRDITAEKEHAAELALAQEALRQSQKMDAMGSLTGGVAHDFNNLLTPIVGSLDLLQRRGVGSEREQRLIAGAMQSAERAKVLVQRLLAFARRQPLQAVAVDLGALVAGMADLVASTTGPQIRVAVDVAEALPAAVADPNQLEMALLNLAVNARDAMPDGGTLRITAAAETVPAGHRTGLPAGRYLCLSVADTGAGMDEATLGRAVEPFFSTKGVGKGTGLGLSMVHGLAQQLGGTLTIQSRREIGTNVEFWLPESAAPAPTAEPAVEAARHAARAGTVLLVDDEEAVRLSTAEMLADLGYRVTEAGCAEEALDLVRGGLRPTLLVTDHLMPGMTGSDLARTVLGEQPGIRVLVISGYAESEGVSPDLPRLTKPFRNDELAASLASG